MSSFTANEVLAMRRVFTWAAMTKRLRWQDYNWLMKSVVSWERRIGGCDGKESFDTFELAKRVAARHHRDGRGRRAYKCDVCGRSHITVVDPARRHSLIAAEKKRHATGI